MPRLDAWLVKQSAAKRTAKELSNGGLSSGALSKSGTSDNKAENEASPEKASTKPSSPGDEPKKAIKRKRIAKSEEVTPPPPKKVKAERLSGASILSGPSKPAGLSGLKIVVTGVFDRCSREDIELEIKRRGGQVMSAVSGKTNILVHGSQLEDGRNYTEGSKYRKAMEVLKSGKNPNFEVLDEQTFTERYLSGTASDEMKDEDTPCEVQQPSAEQPSGEQPTNVPLAEKWRPKHLKELIGNNETVKKLKAWLDAWETTHIKGQPRPVPPSRGFSEPERLNAKAAFLSGPPGIGKTTAAKVVAEECGYSIIEFNASDDRGKSIVEVISDMTSGGTTIVNYYKAPEKIQKKKSLLIMDEIDGLSGSDRGGAQALLKLIASTRIPVILIANDRLNPKLKTITTKTYDLRFNRPPKNTIAKTLQAIGRREGIILDYNGLELLVESVGNDVRQCINVIEGIGYKKKVDYDGFRKIVMGGLKDSKLMSNPFEMSRRLLTKSECANFTLTDRQEGYFLDSSLMPLMVWENYAAALQSLPNLSDGEKLNVLSSVADCYSFGDLMNNAIYKSGNWALLPDVAMATVVYPSATCCSFLGRPVFPSWLGRNSTTTRNRRLCNELCLFLSGTGTTNASIKGLVLDGYVHALYDKLVYSLKEEGGVAKCIGILDEYSITRTHLVEHMTLLRLKTQDKTFEKVDSKTKTSLTVTYNNSSHVIRMAPPRVSVKKRTAMDAVDGETPVADPLEEQEEDESDMAYIDRLIVASKKKAKSKSKTRAPRAAKPKTKSSPKKRK